MPDSAHHPYPVAVAGQPSLLLIVERMAISMWGLVMKLACHYFCHILFAKVNCEASYILKKWRYRLHLFMGGTIKSYYKGHKYKKWWGIGATFAMSHNCQMEFLFLYFYLFQFSSFRVQFELIFFMLCIAFSNTSMHYFTKHYATCFMSFFDLIPQ